MLDSNLPKNVLDLHIQRGGGVVAGPQGLGIIIGKDYEALNCPPGWIFVDVDDAQWWGEDEQLMVLAQLKNARHNWPEQSEPYLPPFKKKVLDFQLDK